MLPMAQRVKRKDVVMTTRPSLMHILLPVNRETLFQKPLSAVGSRTQFYLLSLSPVRPLLSYDQSLKPSVSNLPI